MSGKVGVMVSGQTSQYQVTPVRMLEVGNFIRGVDEDITVDSSCRVEAIGTFGFGPLYGNYTSDHFLYNPDTGNVEINGDGGTKTEETKYELLTSCPSVVDESGTISHPSIRTFVVGM